MSDTLHRMKVIIEANNAKLKQKEFTGILKEFNKDSFTIVIEDNEMTFQRSETALVRLAFDF